MRHRHAVPVNRVVAGIVRRLPGAMGDDLVAIEIEIDPLIAAAPLCAAHDPAPEGARLCKITDRKGEMERA